MKATEEKSYAVMETIFQKINQQYVSLSETDKKRNSYILNQVVEKLIEQMKAKNPLFKNLYQNKYYGGSYYDNLRVSEPNEYDLDFLFAVPKIIEATVVPSDKPGFVYVVFKNFDQLEKHKELHSKFSDLKNFMDGNKLNTKKLLKWMDSVVNLALNVFKQELPEKSVKPKESFSKDSKSGKSDSSSENKPKKNLNSPAIIKVKTDSRKYKIYATISKCGPAYTLKLDCSSEDGSEEFLIDVDIVASFIFSDDQWPKTNYRQNISKTKNKFFVVPKGPDSESCHYWRLSFQEQEKELLSGDYKQLKPCIRLLKKLRDRHKHNISSYAIKTVLLWELEKNDKTVFNKPLSDVFMMVLDRYAEYINNGNIPYYWNKQFNLISDLKEATYSCIGNCLKNITSEVDRNLDSDPYKIATFLLSPEEVEKLKSEVNIGKKHLRKQRNAQAVLENENPRSPAVLIQAEGPSSECFSGETRTKLEAIHNDVREIFKNTTETNAVLNIMMNKMLEIQDICINLQTDNNRLLKLYKGANEKIEDLQEKIDRFGSLEENLNGNKPETGSHICFIPDSNDSLELFSDF